MDEQEFLERFGMTREEYGNQYGVLEDPNMGKGSTLRQKAVDKAAGALQGLGSDQYSAYKTARDFLGDADSSSIAESAGLVDFSLLQLPFAIQETKRAYDRGEKVEAGVGATIALVEMFPGMKLASAPLKGFLRNLGKKSMAKEAPVDLSRRKALGTIAAAPVAATALSDIPVGKIIDDVIPASDIPDVIPVAKKITGVFVRNVGQPEKTTVINELLEMTEFGDKFNYGGATDIKNDVSKLSRELNKAKKYFELKNKTETADELDMLSPNNDIADHLDFVQREFGYTNDEVINFIDETNSITRKNANVWETYLRSGSEGDPEVGKALDLGDESENWENWGENDLFEKIYGSDETDIVGNTIQKAEE